MLNDVKQADVVVRNPTHFAVALKYDPAKAAAPLVLAKGADHLAQRILVGGLLLGEAGSNPHWRIPAGSALDPHHRTKCRGARGGANEEAHCGARDNPSGVLEYTS